MLDWRTLAAIAAGGGFGSVLRYLVGFTITQGFGPGFPWGTFVINVSGSLVLFGPRAAQEAAGNAVPFVVMFNTVAGIAYLFGAAALWRNHRSARWIALAIGVATLIVLAGFAVTALTGTPVELRTALALPFRAAFWLAIAWASARFR